MNKNPVYPGYFADPFAWSHNGTYYAIGTSEVEDSGAADAQGREMVFPLLKSSDLVSWTRMHTNALLRPDKAYGDTFWAPEIAYHNGLFYMYYSVGHRDKQHVLRVAISESAEGPYRDECALTSLDDCKFAIDAHPYRDDDGQWYLFYACDFLDSDASTRAGTALVVDRMESMTKLAGKPQVVLRARSDWQRFMADRPMYDNIYDWHTLEGPCVVKRNDLYYCFYSGGRWEDDTYGVDYGVASSVMGPYSDHGNELGARVLNTAENMIGPGHNSILRSADSKMLIVYHSWDADRSARRMFVDELNWTEDGPRVCGYNKPLTVAAR